MDENSRTHKIATQHRLIESLFEGLANALSARDGDRAQPKAASLRRALAAHFLLEEEHYFLDMRDGKPDRARDLDRLVDEHVAMRSGAEEVLAQLDQAAWQTATEAFDALRSLFTRHEEFERRVIG